MATNKKVIKEIQYICSEICNDLYGRRNRETCELHHSFSAVSRLRLPIQIIANFTADCIVQYFFDNFLICGHWPLNTITFKFDTLTLNRILFILGLNFYR